MSNRLRVARVWGPGCPSQHWAQICPGHGREGLSLSCLPATAPGLLLSFRGGSLTTPCLRRGQCGWVFRGPSAQGLGPQRSLWKPAWLPAGPVCALPGTPGETGEHAWEEAGPQWVPGAPVTGVQDAPPQSSQSLLKSSGCGERFSIPKVRSSRNHGLPGARGRREAIPLLLRRTTRHRVTASALWAAHTSPVTPSPLGSWCPRASRPSLQSPTVSAINKYHSSPE